MISPILPVVAVVAVLCGLLGTLALYRRVCHPHPELPRKLLHVGMGTVTLTFPWLFDAAWPVLLLAALSLALLAGLRLIPELRDGVGQVLHAVPRFSLGEVWFVVAVTILWLLHVRDPGRPLLYVVPVLLLTYADAAAGLIGVYLGRKRYTIPGGTRTREGSAAYFGIALPCVLVPLLGERGWEAALPLAVVVAALTTLCEALAGGGLDNLLPPLLAYLLLALPWDVPTAAVLVVAAAAVALWLTRIPAQNHAPPASCCPPPVVD